MAHLDIITCDISHLSPPTNIISFMVHLNKHMLQNAPHKLHDLRTVRPHSKHIIGNDLHTACNPLEKPKSQSFRRKMHVFCLFSFQYQLSIDCKCARFASAAAEPVFELCHTVECIVEFGGHVRCTFVSQTFYDVFVRFGVRARPKYRS